MLKPTLAREIEAAISEAEGNPFRISEISTVGGGCISQNYRVGNGRLAFFLKVARGADRQFASESDGLQALARCDALVVPRVVARGGTEEAGFLVLAWLDLECQGNEALLGESMATLHGITYPYFGWTTDNFIGTTPQDNTKEADWRTFYWQHRLLPQLQLATERGAPQLLALATPLLEFLPVLFAAYTPVPSLLHGDFWGGNKGFTGGRPCVFDPAVYAGDAETDLAMSELFGGFSPAFYSGYRSARQIDSGYPQRRALYQLYHVLNHFNIFGGSYARQAEQLISRIVLRGSK